MGRTWEKIFPEMPVKPIIGKINIISISGPKPSKKGDFLYQYF